METRKGIIMAVKARTSVSVLDTVTLGGIGFQLRKISEHKTNATAYIVRVTRDGVSTDANFSSRNAALRAYDSLKASVLIQSF